MKIVWGMEGLVRHASVSSSSVSGSVQSDQTGWGRVVYIIAIRQHFNTFFFHRRRLVSLPSVIRSRLISLRRGWSRDTLALVLALLFKRMFYAYRNTGRVIMPTLADPLRPRVLIGIFQKSPSTAILLVLRHIVVNTNMFIHLISCTLTMVGLRTIIRTLSFFNWYGIDLRSSRCVSPSNSMMMIQNSQYLELDDPMSSVTFPNECEDGLLYTLFSRS